MKPEIPNPNRRRLLKIGLAASAALTLAGGVSYWMERPVNDSGRLSLAGRRTFKAISATVLHGSLPQAGPERETQLDAHLERFDRLLTALPKATQQEVAQLFALLGNPLTLYALTGLRGSWDTSSLEDTSLALDRLRTSSLALRQQAYHALRDLTNAAFYADPVAWPLMGYPGPAPL